MPPNRYDRSSVPLPHDFKANPDFEVVRNLDSHGTRNWTPDPDEPLDFYDADEEYPRS